MNPAIRAALKDRYVRQHIDLISRHPTVFHLLASQKDVPTIELALTDGVTIARHDKQKNVILFCTAFNVYLCKLNLSGVLSTFASNARAFKNASIKPYCRWALNAIECTVDPRDAYSIIISVTDYPMNDEGEAIYIDPDDVDAHQMMGVAFSEFDAETGGFHYYTQTYGFGDEDDPTSPTRAPGARAASAGGDNDGDAAAQKKKQKQPPKLSLGDGTEFCLHPPWKTVGIEFESRDEAEFAAQEITRLSVSSVVLRQKWFRRRLKDDGSGFEFADGMSEGSNEEADDEKHDDASEDEADEDCDQKRGSGSKLSTVEERRRKREANRRRNKNAQAEMQLKEGSGAMTAESIRASAEMRKVAALVSADGVSDVKLMRDVLLSRRAAVEARKSLNRADASNNNNNVPPPTIIDPIELLKQHVEQNEETMERVFANHYEKFITFVEKTNQLSVEGVERVQFAHEAIGSAIEQTATQLRGAASAVVESRTVVCRVTQVSQILRKRVAVSRLLESAERCAATHNVFGLAELLEPLQSAVVGDGGLSAADTLAIYVVQIRLPQLRAMALSMATAKLHSWLASLRDCVLSLGQELWRKSIEGSSSNTDDGTEGKRINRMSERVEHIHKRIVNVEPLKSGKEFGWRIEKSVVPTTVDDIGLLFAGESTAQLAAAGSRRRKAEEKGISFVAHHHDPTASSPAFAAPQDKSLSSRLARLRADVASPASSIEIGSSNSVTPASSPTTGGGMMQQQQQHSAYTAILSGEEEGSPMALGGHGGGASDFRGASYGTSLRHLFRLCGHEDQVLSTVLETRRLHLSTLVQSIAEPPPPTVAGAQSFFTAQGFIRDCTRALGYLHCEEMLVNTGDVDLTVTHLLHVWGEVQAALATRADIIGKRNPPSCAALFRTLTHFKTAALGCLLTPLPDSRGIDKARQEQRDSMQAVMANTISATLNQLCEMDELERIEVADAAQFRKSVLALNLQLAGERALPVPAEPLSSSSPMTTRFLVAAAPTAADRASSSQPSRNTFSSTRTFGARHRRGGSTSSPGGGATAAGSASASATVASSSSPTEPPHSSSSSSTSGKKLSQPLHLPYSNVVPAAADLLLGFLNEAFSLGYDSGVDGGLVGANSDEAHSSQGNRVIDPETGVMTDILDGSCHREWVDSTSLAMVEFVLKQVANDFRSKIVPLSRQGDLHRLAMLRNNFAAVRTIVSTLEQRYALLFHGTLDGTQHYGKAVLLPEAGGLFNNMVMETEQVFTVTLLDKVSALLAPMTKLSYWENLFAETEEDIKEHDVKAASSPSGGEAPHKTQLTRMRVERTVPAQSTSAAAAAAAAAASASSSTQAEGGVPAPPTRQQLGYFTSLRLQHLPSFTKKHCVVQAATSTVVEIVEFLQQGGSAATSSSSGGGGGGGGGNTPVWPEHLACAQARTAVCRVADCIRDHVETLVQKCELRKAGRLLTLLPVIASCCLECVDDMMDQLNSSIVWTSTHSASSAASSSAAVTPFSSSAAAGARSNARLQSLLQHGGGGGGGGGGSGAPPPVVVFPFDNMDSYFCKIYSEVEFSAKEYEHVTAKIGANMEMVGKQAYKGASAALSGVMKLGDYGFKGVKSVVGSVAGGAKTGMHAVAGVAEGVGREVGDVYSNLKQELAEDDSSDVSSVDSEKMTEEERRIKHQWDQPSDGSKKNRWFSK